MISSGGRSAASRLAWIAVIVTVFLAPLPTLAAPPNDAFADATVITSLPFESSGDLSDATIEPGEPTGCPERARERTVWFSFAPATDVGVIFHIEQFGVSTALSVYRGSTLADLVCIGATFDEYAFKARAGQTYWFQLWIDEFFAKDQPHSVGLYTASLKQIAVEPNDDIADATDISIPFLDRPDLLGTTLEQGEEACGFENGTVWYRYVKTAGAAEDLIVNPIESGFPGPWISVYEGAAGPAEQLGCSRGWRRPVGFVAHPGHTYWIRVGSDHADSTYFDFPISVEAAHGRVIHGPPDPIIGAPITTTYVQQDGRHAGVGVFSNHSFDYAAVFASLSGPAAGACAYVINVSDQLALDCVAVG